MSTDNVTNPADDPRKTARSVGLVYVLDSSPGITRKRVGQEFEYYDKHGNEITAEESLKRFKSLVIPPAWEKVWICPKPHGHLQVTGIDTKNRKQYRYHPQWSAMRNNAKYFRMLELGHSLPQIRQHLKKDLAERGLTERKVLATAVSLMERTAIRIGSESYKNLYGSFGLTTLRDKHVKVNGNTIRFSFKGKRGIYHEITLQNRKLAKLVQSCKDIPGYELFQYYDDNGERKAIDSGMVNQYIKEISGHDFTAKDFRTWAGTVHALQAFREIGKYEKQSELKRNIVRAIDHVSEKLGNTRTICRKYYIHPAVISAYEDGCIFDHFKQLDVQEQEEAEPVGLTCEEEVVMKLLQAVTQEVSKIPA